MIKATFFGRQIGWLLRPIGTRAKELLTSRHGKRQVYVVGCEVVAQTAIAAHNSGIAWQLV